MSTKANDIQHGGDHYKKFKIQPWDFIAINEIPYLEGDAIAYISRWREKGGVEDLRKAIHFLEKRIELEEDPVAVVSQSQLIHLASESGITRDNGSCDDPTCPEYADLPSFLKRQGK